VAINLPGMPVETVAMSWRGRLRHLRRAVAAIVGLVVTFGSGFALSGGQYLAPLAALVGIAIVLVVVGRQLVALLERETETASLEAEVAARTAELEKSEVRFRSLVQSSSDVITILDDEGTILFQTPSVERVFGYAPGDYVGRTIWELLHPEELSRVRQMLDEAMAAPESSLTAEWRLRTSTGEWAACESTIRSLLREPSVAGIVVNTRDVTERKALEDQLIRDALHDSLTGLANRALLRDRAAIALARAKRVDGQVALMLVDLDDFKAVNDGLGHAAGDEVLVAVSRRLSQCIRPNDTVARLGGDEFAVLIDDVSGDVTPEAVAARIQELLRLPIIVNGHELFANASIGVALADARSKDPEELLRNADVAMYMAKGKGKSQAATFHPEMHVEMRDRITLANELRRAVSQEQFSLRFQPLVDLKTRRIIGMEALVRWQHPQRGLVSPVEFIPMAEATGTIVPLGRWILKEAVDALVSLQAVQRPNERPVSVTINLSPRQFQEPTLLDEIEAVVKDAGVEPWTVVLELTETMLMDDIDGAIESMQRLKQLGVRLALDDFGTGYSSLSYLRRLPIDILKIDKSFVDSLSTAEGPGMVRSILRLGDTFRVATLAEGIESLEQLAHLRALGCTYGQGYLFAQPMRRSEVRRLLEEQSRELAAVPPQ
jgi:diguanylate cyclase (GGDEF)-like protein/PAS domain S-box-containing protein